MRVLSLFLLMFATLASAEPRTLRFSVVDSWAMPLAHIEGGHLTGGILFDLFTATAQKAGLEPDFHILPRARVEHALLTRNVDVRCYVAPGWVEHQFDDYRWSTPIFVQRDLLVAAVAESRSPEQLSNQPIGTVLGYHYPRLQPLFERGKISRDDARNQELVLRKLQAGRYRYAISNEFALNWFNHDLPPDRHLHEVGVIEETTLSCLVLDTPAHPAQPVLDALSALKESGEIERILQRYR